jgi:hypothetical protein
VLLSEAPSITQLLGVALVIGGIAAATVPVARIRDGLAASRMVRASDPIRGAEKGPNGP